MDNSNRELWNPYQSITQDELGPEKIVERIHAGAATFADFSVLYEDWRSAAAAYAEMSSKRFPRAQTETCELCGMHKETKPHQCLFRAFLDREWGKRIFKAIMIVIVGMVIPFGFFTTSSDKSGIRLVFPTYHNICRGCRWSLRWRTVGAYLFEFFAAMLNFVLLVAAALGVIAVLFFSDLLKPGEMLEDVHPLLLLSFLPLLMLSVWATRKLRFRLQLPERIRWIVAGPFEYIPKCNKAITCPTVLGSPDDERLKPRGKE